MRSLYVLCLIGFLSFEAIGQQPANLVGRWFDDELVGSSAFDNAYNEIWGLYVNDVEYAILGTTAGTHFIDLSIPSEPVETFFVEGGTVGPAIIHRDYHDKNGYLYIVADEGGASTLQIVDIRDLPNSINVVYDSGDLIRRTHNIFIDDFRDKLYAGISQGNTNNYSPLRVFDISDPENPTEINSYNSFGDFQVGQVHDLYVRNDTAYLNCGPSGFAIVDFSDMTNPQPIATLSPQDYPQSGYNHSGWLSEDGNYYYMADETWGMDIKVLDLTNLPDIFVSSLINAGSDNAFTIPHNQIVHDGYLYGAYYYDGFVAWELSDPANPILAFQYSTTDYEHKANYEGAWGVYPFLPSGLVLVSDMQYGLFVLELGEFINTKDNFLNAKVDVFPNPTIDKVNIELPADVNGQIHVSVFDLQGKLLLHSLTTYQGPFTLSLPFESGSYILKIEDEINTFQSMIQIMH